MIRERRGEDLGPLCDVLTALRHPCAVEAGSARAWLEEDDAEQSWVFDMAPVTVAPTRNVVGHVQIRPPADGPAVDCLVEHTGVGRNDMMAVGKLFVGPIDHRHNIGRFLLKQSVAYIRSRRMTPIVDPQADGFFPAEFYEGYGFHQVPCDGPRGAPMMHAG